jgi:hypothetical protein
MTGTDYHRAYFAVISLRQQQTPAAHERIAAIRQSLITAQSDTRDESGTWSPTDQWSRAGGRIHSTALASLTLHQAKGLPARDLDLIVDRIEGGHHVGGDEGGVFLQPAAVLVHPRTIRLLKCEKFVR